LLLFLKLKQLFSKLIIGERVKFKSNNCDYNPAFLIVSKY
jgi:hypothetical protein